MRKSTEQKLKDMRAMYESGMSIKEIADKMGYMPGTVQTMLSKTGLSREKFAMDHITDLVKMREDGMTLAEISEKTGFCISTICKNLNKAGCRKNVMHDVRPSEPIIDESKLIYAKPRKAPERMVEGGKRYVDVLDSLYDTPDIMSL
ncbi:hypothetical protein [Kineothrix sedimenti]|uniref:Helix-turn-helix protein n=1 Tax=Kineothrix sedimenti TaxID=3123317 RepID=A0ABZ3ESG2_9FIRM